MPRANVVWGKYLFTYYIINNLIFKNMKKFTLLATLAAAFISLTASAEKMDKPFYRMTKFATVQDATVTAPETGTNPITVKSNKTNNTPRYLYTTWGADAFAKMPATLPDNTYSFSTKFKIASDAGVSNCLEMVLYPVDGTWKLTHMRLFNSNDYFFRFHQAENCNTETNTTTLYVNGDINKDAETPSASDGDADWNFGQKVGTPVEVSVGTQYTIRVDVNTVNKTAVYTIFNNDNADAVVATGSKDISALATDKIGGIWFNTSGGATYEFNDMKLSTVQDGPFANTPRADLFHVQGQERDFLVQFSEGEVLHWIQLGNATTATEEELVDGQEYTANFSESKDNRDFEEDQDLAGGSKIIYCTKSGDLRIWTTREEDETNRCDEDLVVAVECVDIVLPAPKATITNVSEGYGKEYTLSVDNSEVLLTPTITIAYKLIQGSDVKEAKVLSGAKVSFTGAGRLEIYSLDNSHGKNPYYTQSETVIEENNTEYVKATSRNYAISKEEAEGTMEGFTKTEIVDNANKSHWDRIYSTQSYGKNADGNIVVNDGTVELTEIKTGFGFYDASAIGSDNAKWPAQMLNKEALETAALPLVLPTVGVVKDVDVDASWHLFPLEGLVSYQVPQTNLDVNIDSKYVSDDAAKPNFYVVHTRGGYDRPDKGDSNATTVVEAGKSYSLYRYDTAICDVTVYTYKGFVEGSGATEVAAPKAVVEDANAPIYTIGGVKVSTTEAGKIYIQNGKKFLAK